MSNRSQLFYSDDANASRGCTIYGAPLIVTPEDVLLFDLYHTTRRYTRNAYTYRAYSHLIR